MELDSYLVVARGSPPLVAALSLRGAGGAEGGEGLAPAAHAARPTAADVDLAAGHLYYCDVHRCGHHLALAAGATSESYNTTLKLLMIELHRNWKGIG